jgi:hypothetical protein
VRAGSRRDPEAVETGRGHVGGASARFEEENEHDDEEDQWQV